MEEIEHPSRFYNLYASVEAFSNAQLKERKELQSQGKLNETTADSDTKNVQEEIFQNLTMLNVIRQIGRFHGEFGAQNPSLTIVKDKGDNQLRTKLLGKNVVENVTKFASDEATGEIIGELSEAVVEKTGKAVLGNAVGAVSSVVGFAVEVAIEIQELREVELLID
ncbi:MAG: hypothetical protein R3Y54_13435, partial [Eubacteriales bacterium]